MRKTLLFTILVIFVLSLFVACQPAEPEVQEVAEPEPQAEPEPVVEEEPVVTATALYDGVPVLYSTMLRGDTVTVTGEDGEYYIIDNNGIQMLIEKSMVKLSTEEAFEPESKVLDEPGVLYANAYLKGDITEIPAGTVVNVEDSFNGILFVKYTDEIGNEVSGYMSETDTSFAKEKSKSDGDSSKKSGNKKNKKSSGSSGSSGSAPIPQQQQDEPAEQPSTQESQGEVEVNLDDWESLVSRNVSDDYGIVLLSVNSTELTVTENPQSDEGAEPPAGLAGDDQSDNPEGTVPEEESIYPIEGMVFSDGAEVYIGKLVKDTVYTVESADDTSVIILYDEVNTGSVPRWSLAMEGDIPYEVKQMYLVDDVIVYSNCFGRGDGITATKNALVNIIGETGDYYILQFEDGSVFYLLYEGGDAYFISPEEFEAQQTEEQNDSDSDKEKSSKKNKSSKKLSAKKSDSGSSQGTSEPTPTPAPEPSKEEKPNDNEQQEQITGETPLVF